MSQTPLHMDDKARNERLYKTLVEMGLFVEAVYCPNDPDVIDYILVSASLPTVATTDVIPPVKRTQVRENVGPTARDGDNVIDFPPVV